MRSFRIEEKVKNERAKRRNIQVNFMIQKKMERRSYLQREKKNRLIFSHYHPNVMIHLHSRIPTVDESYLDDISRLVP